jgi:hypothetical protein
LGRQPFDEFYLQPFDLAISRLGERFGSVPDADLSVNEVLPMPLPSQL